MKLICLITLLLTSCCGVKPHPQTYIISEGEEIQEQEIVKKSD